MYDVLVKNGRTCNSQIVSTRQTLQSRTESIAEIFCKGAAGRCKRSD